MGPSAGLTTRSRIGLYFSGLPGGGGSKVGLQHQALNGGTHRLTRTKSSIPLDEGIDMIVLVKTDESVHA